MKNLLNIFAVILILSGCKATVNQAASSTDFSNRFNPLTSVEQQALDAVLASSAERMTRGYNGPSPDLNEFEWSAHRYYKLDVEKFMENPDQWSIMEYVYAPSDWVILVGKNAEQEYVEIEVNKQDDDQWSLYRTMKISKQTQNWIEGVAAKADSRNYSVVVIYSRPYYVFTIDGQPTYYSPGGIPQTAESVCKFIKMVYENAKEVEATGDIGKMLVL